MGEIETDSKVLQKEADLSNTLLPPKNESANGKTWKTCFFAATHPPIIMVQWKMNEHECRQNNRFPDNKNHFPLKHNSGRSDTHLAVLDPEKKV